MNSAETRRLLLVDEEPNALDAMQRYFQELGYAADLATEWEEAQALLIHAAYSVVIIDLRAVGERPLCGFESLRVARERRPEVCLIALNEEGDREVEECARLSGADIVLDKCVALPDLAQIVLTMDQTAWPVEGGTIHETGLGVGCEGRQPFAAAGPDR